MNNAVKQAGSKPFSFSLSDGLGTVRDSILLLISTAVSNFDMAWEFFDIPAETEAALTLVIYTGLKALWKFFNDTQRVSPL